MSAKRIINGEILYRSFEIQRADVGEGDDRTVKLSFSSEKPIEQYNWDYGRYLEILDHSPGAVDMSRMQASAPLLLEHSRDSQIGVIEKASIDGDRIGRAVVRFGRSELANEIYTDVRDGIRRLVSVGYRIDELTAEKIDENGLDTLRATKWMPMEISIVAVPADISVGVGRSKPTDGHKITIKEQENMRINRDHSSGGGGGGTPNPNPQPSQTPADAVVQLPTLARDVQVREMFGLCRTHNLMELYEPALERGVDLPTFQKEILGKIAERAKNNPITERRPGTENRTFGELFVASEEYKRAVAARNHRTIAVTIPITNARATLLTTTGLTGYNRPPGIVTLGQQPLTIAQLFAQGTTDLPTVRVTQEVSFTNAATSVAEEGQKPEASFDLVETDFGVKKIAVLGRVSDEMFADFPFVQSYVNSRLIFMVGAKEDNLLLNGAGAGSDPVGILATSGIQTVAAGASPTPIDAIFKAITKIAAVGFFTPDYIVVNPTDWQNIKLTKDANGQYLAGGPFTGAYGVGDFMVAGTLWGLPLISTTAIAQGTALVGSFQLGAQLFRREGIRVETTNSDASDFAYNRICIRVETRVALAVYRPLAFCTVTGIPLV